MSEESSVPFAQSQAVRDHIFPLVEIQVRDGQPSAVQFLGTGFFIGSRNFALTAAHVLRGASRPVAIFVAPDGQWVAYSVVQFENHTAEDVAVIELRASSTTTNWSSAMRLSADHIWPAQHYHLWGYPEDAAYELVSEGRAVLRPDLVYSEGHIRRRMSDIPLPVIVGHAFYELSAPVGLGCSGSPVMIDRPDRSHDVIGVYVGERLSDGSPSVGYATRLEELHDWKPELLGRPLLEEANGAISPESN